MVLLLPLLMVWGGRGVWRQQFERMCLLKTNGFGRLEDVLATAQR